MNDSKLDKILNDLLLKKAKGFYYTEEQFEYEKTQNKSLKNKNQYENISFFDFDVSHKSKTNDDSDTIKSSNGENSEQENLTLIKKKITTHYIPPDMLAIKILFENNREKVNENDITKLSDEELINLQEKLIGEILNENKQD